MDIYEQKYKEALEKAKEQLEGAKVFDYKEGQIAHDIRTTTYAIFPELSESEDELTWLTKYIEEEAYSLSMDIRDNEDRIKHEKLQKALAWLEKQKEPELSEDLGEYIAELSKQFPEVSFAKLSRIAVRVKNWLENEGETEYALKSYKDEDVRKFMQQIKKEAKDYEFNLPNRDYDIYNFAKDILAWLEKQGENKSTTIDIDKMVSKYANTREDCTNGLPVNCQIRAYRQGINDALKSALNLEKQGEHKKFRDSIQVGDEVTRNSDGVIVNMSQLKRVAKPAQQKLPIEMLPEEMKTIGESLGFTTQEECDEYNQIVSDLIMSDNDKGEQKQKPTNEDMKEALRTEYEKGRADAFAEMQKKWSDEDKERIKNILSVLDVQVCWNGATGKKENPYQKEINWLKSLKDRVQPKQEWSEEDNHEHFSELLENDNSDNIDDYAYQCAYCMSHDWIKESPTWDDVERACKLGAEWNEKHHKSAWSEEDKDFMYDTLSNLAELKGRYGEGYGNVGKCIDWLKSLKDRIGG